MCIRDSNNGLPSTSETWDLKGVVELCELNTADMNEGDTFSFAATVKRDDGIEFTLANTGVDLISSPAYQSFLGFSVTIEP